MSGTVRAPSNAIRRGPALVTLGDSETDRATTFAANSYLFNAGGYVTWLRALSKQAFYYPVGWSGTARTGNNAGVSGDTVANGVTNMLSRVGADVLAKTPDLCIFWGGTNDLNGIVTKAGIDTMFASWKSIVGQLINANIQPVVMPIMPRTDFDATERPLAAYLNWLIQDYCQRNRGIIFINILPLIVDPTSATGAEQTGLLLSADHIHTSPLGAYTIANKIWSTISALFPSPYSAHCSQADVLDATLNPFGNMVTNGLMAGTAGTNGTGSSGNIATSYSSQRTVGATMTVVGSKVSRTDGIAGESQRLVFATTSVGVATETCTFRPTAGITSTVGVDYVYSLEVEVITPAANVKAMFISNTDGTQLVRDFNADTDNMPNVAWSGVMQTPVWTAIGPNNFPTFTVTMDGTLTGSLTVNLSRMVMRRAD